MYIQDKFNPIIGNIQKAERKFVCTKPHLLYDYLNDRAQFMHYSDIEQKQSGGVKYRKYTYNGKVTYVKHILEHKSGIIKKVSIDEIVEQDYNSIKSHGVVRKTRLAYRLDQVGLTLSVDIFDKGKMVVEVWSTADKLDELNRFIAPKGLEEVTKIDDFSYNYIANHKDNILTKPLIIIEGTDLIGKSTIVKELIQYGYICLDRDQYDFSNYVTLYENPHTSAERIRQAYTGRQNYKIIVLYTSDNSLISDRLSIRIKNSEISEYDMEAEKYNTVYMSILDHLSHSGIDMIGIDVYGKSVRDIVNNILDEVR